MPLYGRLEHHHPRKGDETSVTELGTMLIVNTTGMADVSDFFYRVHIRPLHQTGRDFIPGFETEGTLTGHYRIQNYWHLVRRVLQEALPPYLSEPP